VKVFLPEGHKQERMQSLDQEGKVVYASKDGKSIKVSQAMEWLAGCVHTYRTGVSRWCGTKDYAIRDFITTGYPHFNYKPKNLDL
jgi:hypothetical protein